MPDSLSYIHRSSPPRYPSTTAAVTSICLDAKGEATSRWVVNIAFLHVRSLLNTRVYRNTVESFLLPANRLPSSPHQIRSLLLRPLLIDSRLGRMHLA